MSGGEWVALAVMLAACAVLAVALWTARRRQARRERVIAQRLAGAAAAERVARAIAARIGEEANPLRPLTTAERASIAAAARIGEEDR